MVDSVAELVARKCLSEAVSEEVLSGVDEVVS